MIIKNPKNTMNINKWDTISVTNQKRSNTEYSQF